MTYYNELFNTDGQVRPHYAEVLNYWKSLPPKDRRALHVRSKRLFAGDYAQDPLPRLLTQDEFQFLSRGVEQRARAILAFLRDYCVKGSRWNRIMPASTLHTMIARHHMGNLLRKINPDQLAFPYGPDIIRDQAGRWRVVEDSAGFIGGIGDLLHGQKILNKLMPGLRDLLPSTSDGVNDPQEFFSMLARHFSQKAAQNDGIPLLYLRPYKDESDQETRRLAQTFAQFGIESTTSTNHLRKIEIREGKDAGIFLKSAGRTQRIGALIFHAGPEQLDNRALRIQMTKLRDPKNRIYMNEIVQAFIRAL
ncbi:MAG: circularly permuted type 2 ATP-grasp protein, partial [Bdellovibrionota bacterium]